MSMALSLRLYSLEIRLKTYHLQDTQTEPSSQGSARHTISQSSSFSPAYGRSSRIPQTQHIRQNWDLLVDFSKQRLNDQRYLPRATLDPKDLKSYNDASMIQEMEYLHGYQNILKADHQEDRRGD